MWSVLKHKFSKKEKFLAQWSFTHVAGALVAGVVLAGWLVIWQIQKDTVRTQELNRRAAQTVDQFTPVPPDTGKIGGPFTLTDQNGKQVSDRDFVGKYLLVYFGYTSCPDMCPTGLKSMSIALDRLGGDAARVQPLFITVDPARDTPARLREYDASYNPRIIGLTGSDQQIAAVAKEYQVYYEKGEGDSDYEVDHSGQIYLIDPGGNLVATFDEEVNPQKIIDALHSNISGQKP